LWAAIGGANGWRVLHDKAATAVTSGRPHQRRAIVADPTTSHETIRSRLDNFFDAQVGGYLVEDHWGRRVWQADGFELHRAMPIMSCAAPRRRVDRLSQLHVLRVDTAVHLGVFERTLIKAFPFSNYPPGRRAALLTPAVLAVEGLHLWLGYAGADAVATACSWVHGGYVGVYWVAVLPEYRRRGYASTMTQAATSTASSAPSLLIATVTGRPVYERMGYRVTGTATWWTRCRPPPDGVASHAAEP
jgi:GNAT superfamily N-acetyltransferase